MQWVLLRFERPSVGGAWDCVTHSFLIARKMLASVVDQTAQSMLNIEAKPFVPRSARQAGRQGGEGGREG